MRAIMAGVLSLFLCLAAQAQEEPRAFAVADGPNATITLMDAQGACPDGWRAMVAELKDSAHTVRVGCWHASILVNDNTGDTVNLDPAKFKAVGEQNKPTKPQTQFQPDASKRLYEAER